MDPVYEVLWKCAKAIFEEEKDGKKLNTFLHLDFTEEFAVWKMQIGLLSKAKLIACEEDVQQARHNMTTEEEKQADEKLAKQNRIVNYKHVAMGACPKQTCFLQ